MADPKIRFDILANAHQVLQGGRLERWLRVQRVRVQSPVRAYRVWRALQCCARAQPHALMLPWPDGPWQSAPRRPIAPVWLLWTV